MFTCAECEKSSCREGRTDNLPKNCPGLLTNFKEETLREYNDEILRFARQAALTESKGYCQWTRVQEIIHFSKAMDYHKIGIAFCIGLKQEARILAKILRSHSFEVVSVVCKNGSTPKSFLGLSEEEKVRPGQFEAMCDPISQARLLNHAGVDFNVVVGLCVGHDSLFLKYAEAPATVLVAKDRVLAHNPAGALYCAEGYFKKKLYP